MAASMSPSDDVDYTPKIQALSLQDSSPPQPKPAEEEEGETACIFCEDVFDVSKDKDRFLGHLLLNHKLVIADVKHIANFTRYIEHWKKRFRQQPITDFCSVIETNTKPTDPAPREKFFLLCDVLPEDKLLRQNYQLNKLTEVLEILQKEREDKTPLPTGCLWCAKYTGNKADLLHHMLEKHSFNIGLPDNIVHIKEFLGALKEKLTKLVCLYCEKTFTDQNAFKEHMRKKKHRRIKENNPIYDKYYVINYLELGKDWQKILEEDDREILDYKQTQSSEEEWGDWQEEGGDSIVCLFCPLTVQDASTALDHMKDVHKFDLRDLRKSENLDFYQQVKLVNYIRRKVYQHICPFCAVKLGNQEELLQHLEAENHIVLPSAKTWDHPEYFFPTFEDDNLLCALEDDANEDEDTVSCDAVIPEDPPVTSSILEHEELRRELLQS